MNYSDFCLQLQAKEIIRTFEELFEWKKKHVSSGNRRDIRDVLRLYQLQIDMSTFLKADFHDGACLWKTVEIQAEKQGIEMPVDFRDRVADCLEESKDDILRFGITLEKFNADLPKIRKGLEWNLDLFDHALLAIAKVLCVQLIIISDNPNEPPLHLNETTQQVLIVAYSNGNAYNPVDIMTGAKSKQGAVYEPKLTPKALNLISISICGFYSYATPHHFLLHNNKLLLTGPNNGGKSNVTRAIAFVLGNFPMAPSNNMVEEIKYKGPCTPAGYALALKFALDDETANTLARLIVYGHLARAKLPTGVDQWVLNNETKIESIIAQVAMQLSSIQLAFREVEEGYLQPLVLCQSTSSVFDIDKDNLHVVAFDSYSFDSYEEQKVGFHVEIVETIKETLEVEYGGYNGSWWSLVQKFPKHQLIAKLCEKPLSQPDNNWKMSSSPSLADIIANLVRDSVAFLPQDRGLFGKDRHSKSLHIFTAKHALQTIQDANMTLRCDLLEEFTKQMQKIGIRVDMPLCTSQALVLFAKFKKEKKSEWRKILERFDQEDEAVCRLLGLLLNKNNIIDRIKEELNNSEDVPNFPLYTAQLRELLGIMLDRKVLIEDVFDRQQLSSAVAYHTVQGNLPASQIQFSCLDNTQKSLTLGALYGSAQQFVIIYCMLYMGNFGTIILDEPEVSLHFTSRVKLQRMLQNLTETSIVISTHAEEFVTEEWLPALYHCSRSNTQSQTKSFSADIRRHFDNRVIQRATNSDIRPLFFANKVLFVEGPNDVRFVETLIQLASKDKYMLSLLEKQAIDVEKLSSWICISLSSSSNAPITSQLADALGLNWAILLDNDALENSTAKNIKERFPASKPAASIIADKFPTQFKEIANLMSSVTEAEREMNAELDIIDDANKEQKKAIQLKYQPIIMQQKVKIIKAHIKQITSMFHWQGEMEEVFFQTPLAVDVLLEHSTKKPEIPSAKKKKQTADQSKCRICSYILEPIWICCPACGKQKLKDSTLQSLEEIKKEWICNKNSTNSLHNTWSYVPTHALEEALKLLIINENEEFLRFCRFLTQ